MLLATWWDLEIGVGLEHSKEFSLAPSVQVNAVDARVRDVCYEEILEVHVYREGLTLLDNAGLVAVIAEFWIGCSDH